MPCHSNMSRAVHLNDQQRKCLLEAGDLTLDLAKRLPYKPRAEDRVPMQKCFALSLERKISWTLGGATLAGLLWWRMPVGRLRLLFQLCRPVKLVGVIVGGWAAMTLAPFSEANAAACMSGMALTSSPLGAEFRAQLAARDPMHPLLRLAEQMNLAPTPRMLSEAEQDAQDPFLHRSQPQQDGSQHPWQPAEWSQPSWEHARQQEHTPAEGSTAASELQMLGDPFDLTSLDAEPDTSGRGQPSVSPGRLSRHELRRQRLLERRQQHVAGGDQAADLVEDQLQREKLQAKRAAQQSIPHDEQLPD